MLEKYEQNSSAPMPGLPYFLYAILSELRQVKAEGCKNHPSWCTEQIRLESEQLLDELRCMDGSQDDPIQQMCFFIMKISQYQVEASLWIRSMELLLCKYCH